MKQQTITLHNLNTLCHGSLLINEQYQDKNLPFILIVPGGAYNHLSIRESGPVSDRFLSFGYNTGILYYSLYPDYIYPTAEIEINTTIEYLSHQYPNIILCGFSAGGHLVGLAYSGKYSHLIKGAIFSYAVINLIKDTNLATRENFLGKDKDDLKKQAEYSIDLRIHQGLSPAFIWCTKDDEAVPYNNSLRLIEALKKHNIAYESHIFPSGPHGIALGDKTTIKDNNPQYLKTDVATWPLLARTFINKLLY